MNPRLQSQSLEITILLAFLLTPFGAARGQTEYYYSNFYRVSGYGQCGAGYDADGNFTTWDEGRMTRWDCASCGSPVPGLLWCSEQPTDTCSAASGWECEPGELSACGDGGVSECMQLGCGSAWGDCEPEGPDDEDEPDSCSRDVGNPVNLLDGDVSYTPTVVDAEVLSSSTPLRLERKYSSNLAFKHTEMFGLRRSLLPTPTWGGGWYHQFEHALVETVDDTGNVISTYHRHPNGDVTVFDANLQSGAHPHLNLNYDPAEDVYTLDLLDGTIVEFERAPGGSGKTFRPRRWREPSGRTLWLYYYVADGSVLSCRANPYAMVGQLCLVGGDDGSFLNFAFFAKYTDPDRLWLHRLKYGSVNEGKTKEAWRTTSIPDNAKATEYWHMRLPRSSTVNEILISNAVHFTDVDDIAGSAYFIESYSYSAQSYERADLDASSPYYASSSITAADGLNINLLTRAATRASYEGERTLVSGHEYTPDGRGAASMRPGEYLRIEYFDEEGRRVVTNESTGAVIEYLVENDRIVGINDDCGCGFGATGAFESDATNGYRPMAKWSLDPDGDGPLQATRTTYTYDTYGRVALRIENCEELADPQTIDPLSASLATDIETACVSAPFRVRRHEYESGIVSLPGVDSKVMSAICDHPESEFSSLCDGYDPRVVRVFDSDASPDLDAESVYGMTFDSSSPSTPVEATRTTVYERDAVGRLLEIQRPDGAIVQHTYYESDTEVGGCGAASSNNVGQLKATEYVPSGGTAITVSQYGGYDALGRAGCSVDENGVVTAHQCDELGRVEAITVNEGGSRTRQSSYAYDAAGNMVSTTSGAITRSTDYSETGADCDGGYSTGCLEALGRLRKPLEQTTLAAYGTSPAVEVAKVVTEYNQTGDPELIKHLAASGNIRRQTGYGYEERTGLQTERHKYVGDSEVADFMSYTEYDLLKRVVATQGEQFEQANRQITYDALGRVDTVTVGTTNPATTTYTYDAHDNLATVTDPEGRVTKYLYDDFGQLSIVVSPDSGETHYFYDVAGNLEWRAQAYGTSEEIWTMYEYDGRNRLETVWFHYYDSGSVVDRTFLYDEPVEAAVSTGCGGYGVAFDQQHVAGRVSMVDNESTVVYYSYNPFGEVEAVYELSGEPNDFDVCALRITRYEYDDSGRIAAITYPSRRRVEYQYGPGVLWPSRLELVEPGASSAIVLADNITYDVDGQVSGYVSNGVSFGADWDLAGQGKYRKYEGAPGHWFTWTIDARDGGGNIERVGDEATGKSLTLSYDDQERLTIAEGESMRGYQDCGYGYDLTGNRTSETCYPHDTGKAVTYGYEVGTNRLTSLDWDAGGACGRTIAVDEQGRAKSYYAKRFAASTDEMSLTYGDSGRLESVDVDGDEFDDVFYSYDHRELRVEVMTNSLTRTSTYDPSGQLLAETESGSSSMVVEYVWLAGMPLAMLVDADGGGSGTAVAYTLGVDHLGTAQRAWNESAEFAWAADYEAFGKAWEYVPNSTAAPSIDVNLRFPGQYLDRETGLHYNWHRYYDPNTGRYLTPDPLGLDGGDSTMYAYAAGSPLMQVDPEGLTTYSCRTPLDALGGRGSRSGPDVPGNPLYHEYLCVKSKFWGTQCVGQSTEGGRPYGKGVPSHDVFDAARCRKAWGNDDCVDSCVIVRGALDRPAYGVIGPGTNCQEWASGVLADCINECARCP